MFYHLFGFVPLNFLLGSVTASSAQLGSLSVSKFSEHTLIDCSVFVEAFKGTMIFCILGVCRIRMHEGTIWKLLQ
jgi:hypothetical protein